MFFKESRKDIARCDVQEHKLIDSIIPLETYYLDKASHKELSLFSRKNISYVDNRKIMIISNSVIFIKL